MNAREEKAPAHLRGAPKVLSSVAAISVHDDGYVTGSGGCRMATSFSFRRGASPVNEKSDGDRSGRDDRRRAVIQKRQDAWEVHSCAAARTGVQRGR